jgi:type IV secretion system protein VirB10
MPEEKPEIETHAVTADAHSPSAQLANARVQDKRVLPEGVVPKQAQGYVVAGLAVLILLAVMFSKNHAKTATVPAATQPSPATFSNDVNARRIAELEQNLDEEQRQSQQAQLQAQKAGETGPAAGNAATAIPDVTRAAEPRREVQVRLCDVDESLFDVRAQHLWQHLRVDQCARSR